MSIGNCCLFHSFSTLFLVFVILTLCISDSFDALHVYAGQTATLSYTRKVRESRVDFRGWRVKKNGEVFGGLKKEPGSVYQCTDALLWQFCLTKTEFLKLEESLLLRIRNTSVNDSGNYTVEWVFNSLESNDKEEMQLDVSKGIHTVLYSTSVIIPTKDNASSKPTTAKLSVAVASASSAIIPMLLCLFCLMCLLLLF